MKKIGLLILVFIWFLTAYSQGVSEEEKQAGFAGMPLLGYSRTADFSAGLMLNAYYRVHTTDTISPASSTSLIGVYTTNRSYFAVLAQQLYLSEDRWRIQLLAGFGNANLQMYHEFDPAGQYVDYTTKMSLLSLDVKRKVYKSWYLGVSGALASAHTIFSVLDPLTGAYPEDRQGLNNLGVNVLFDKRNNLNYPVKGLQLFLNNQFFENWMGNDSSFYRLEFTYTFYHNFKSEKRVILLRYYSKMSFGAVPFQGQNVVRGDDIRGYSKGKYRDNIVSAYQIAYRHRFENRFGFVAFVGVATAVPDLNGFMDATYLPGGGLGLRYMLLEKQKINIGLDAAIGKDDWSLTFRIGEAFSR